MLWFSHFALATRSLKPITLEIHKMKKQEPSSTQQSDELTSSWERQLQALDARLRASGRTVTVTEPSDTTEFVATFPQGKKPKTRSKESDDLQ